MTYRNIDTSVWKDDWFLDLQPDEKLLFIYLFSNENTLLTGLYKISLRVIEFETGLSREFIATSIDKFTQAKKVFYENGIIWVVNLRKYNDSRSPKVVTRIAWELKQIPNCPIKNAYLKYSNMVSSENNAVPIEYPYSIDTDSEISPLTLTNQSINNDNPTDDDIDSIPATDGLTGEIYRQFENEICLLTPILSEKIGGWIDTYPLDWIKDAIKVAVDNNVRKPNYIDKILSNWKIEGRNGTGKKIDGKVYTEVH